KISALSLHDALPIYRADHPGVEAVAAAPAAADQLRGCEVRIPPRSREGRDAARALPRPAPLLRHHLDCAWCRPLHRGQDPWAHRSEEHTSELQSREK